MPGLILNATAMVKCAHGGMAKPAATFPKVLLSGQPIVLLVAPFPVAGCPLPPPPAANGPCVLGKFVVGATKILANGIPVLLQDSQAVCVPTGTPLLVGVPQTKVSGV